MRFKNNLVLQSWQVLDWTFMLCPTLRSSSTLKGSSLRGFEYLTRMPPGSLLSEMFWAHREEALGPPLSFVLLIYFKN